MIRLFPAILALGALASPAFAEPSCKASSAELPMWQVAKSFEDAGGSIQKVQRTNGCFEIYGKRADKRVEAFFDPTTGKQIAEE
ncbi:MAG: PepSY domain-containing protein [Amaricoccus sp.]